MSAMDIQGLGMVPVVIETSGRGERAYDIYSRLLRERVVLSGDVTVTGVDRAAGMLRVALVQTSDPRAGRITLVFGERPFQLASWVVVDGQGATTRITLSEIEPDVALDPQLFEFREEPANRN